MKLIDGDKLRAKCIDISKENECGSNLISKAVVATLDLVIGLIDNYPTIDAVPVVRCKDCKHNTLNYKSGNALCEYEYNNRYERDWYCADGKRREK